MAPTQRYADAEEFSLTGLHWRELYRRPLTDLGSTGNDGLRGIYSPGYDPAVIAQYVQSQFLAEAEGYASRYTDTGYWRGLLVRALQTTGVDPVTRSGRVILDLGSGAGNTIFPLLELFPGSQVIASDLSVQMLALLKRALERHGVAERCGLMELNAEDLDFLPGSFDLVIGGAVLHHLLHPDRTIEGCARALKPGGHAIFFEPFENGNAILGRIYATILARPEGGIPPAVRQFLRHFVLDSALRKGRDKSAPIFRQLDDKWVFTRRYLQELLKDA